MKRFSIFFICILILISALSATAQDAAPEVFTSGDWNYIKNDNGITLTKYNGNESHLEIPGELDGLVVNQLEKELFMNNMNLESVSMPDSITAIGANAFNGCAALKNVKLSNGLKAINTGLFRYCISLEQITIPFTVTSINGYAFADCIQLKEILLLSVTTIGESAFDNCMMLTDVKVSGKLTTVNGRAFRDTPWLDSQTDDFVFMGKNVLIKYNGMDKEVEIPYGTTMISSAFEENYMIESVYIPETVKNIGQYAFRECINLKKVNIPDYATTIGASAFNSCKSLTEISLPEGFKSLGGSAFRYCSNLSSINIPSSVTNLPDAVLADCPALTDIIIPNTVKTIHKNAFLNSPNVKLYVTPDSDAEHQAQEYSLPYDHTLQVNNNFIYSLEEDGIRIIRYTGSFHDVEVPAEINGTLVTSIGAAAFQNNRKVSRILLPLTIQSIDDWAFSYMDNLEYIQISENLKSLGANVFTGDNALKEIKFSEQLNEIGSLPLDSSTNAVICAMPDSYASEELKSMGYQVQAMEACSQDEELLAYWGELNGTEITATVLCDCSKCGGIPTEEAPAEITYQETTASGNVHLIRIPDSLTKVTSDLLPEDNVELIIIIPASVTHIDEQILTGRPITIIGDSGSAAETFARQNGIRFTLRMNIVLPQ